ncbi:TIGR01841 family phasin [Variovorax sp. LjRoot130]|uniref:phasin family protein n=1 Tax=Variovorax sp. LjRoot130 TaxID=3342261 RepID=UPI003ED0082A
MATEINPFGDMKKMLEQLKMPGVDMTAIVEARRKDVEALVEANKAAYESMQAMVRKQSEMMAEAMQVMQEVAKGATSGGIDPAKQTEVVRSAFEKTIADMKELAEMARRSQSDAMAHITQRAAEHVDEIKKMMQPK